MCVFRIDVHKYQKHSCSCACLCLASFRVCVCVCVSSSKLPIKMKLLAQTAGVQLGREKVLLHLLCGHEIQYSKFRIQHKYIS